MHVELAAVRGTVGLGHVLSQDLEGLRAHHEQGAKIAGQG